MALYGAYTEGKPSPLPELPIQYADFALWQRETLEGEALESLVSYWKNQLRGVAQLNLRADHSRPAVPSYRGASRVFLIDGALTDALKSLSRQQDVTLFMTLVAAFQTLHRYSRQTDIVVGTDLANRTGEETNDSSGSSSTCSRCAQHVRHPDVPRVDKTGAESSAQAYAHQDLPFEKLVAALNLERDLSRFPVFQAALVLQNAPLGTLTFSGLEMRSLPIENRTVKFHLIMFLMERQGQLIGRLDYSTDLFRRAHDEQFFEKLQDNTGTGRRRA